MVNLNLKRKASSLMTSQSEVKSLLMEDKFTNPVGIGSLLSMRSVIVEIYKNTNKNRTLHWSRDTNEQYKKDKASKLSRVTQEDIEFIKKDILMYDNLIAEEQAVIDKFDEIKASREIPDFMKESVNERYTLISERIETYKKQRAERQNTLRKFEERLKTVLA